MDQNHKMALTTATRARLLALQCVHEAASGHPGGSMSCMDLLTVLYFGVMRIDPDAPHNPFKDPNLRNIFRNAPTVVFIAHNPNPCSQVDCGLLAGNMVNTAHALGIGSCIQMGPVQFLKTDTAKHYLDKLNFSDGYELLMAIGFGYPDESPDPKPRDTSKIKYID